MKQKTKLELILSELENNENIIIHHKENKIDMPQIKDPFEYNKNTIGFSFEHRVNLYISPKHNIQTEKELRKIAEKLISTPPTKDIITTKSKNRLLNMCLFYEEQIGEQKISINNIIQDEHFQERINSKQLNKTYSVPLNRQIRIQIYSSHDELKCLLNSQNDMIRSFYGVPKK